MFSTEVFIEKMVASYLSSSKNKKVSDVQKESLSQIMKSFILQMNPFITPNEADRAIEYGVLKSRGSGVMVSLKTDYEKEKTDGIRRPIIIITVKTIPSCQLHQSQKRSHVFLLLNIKSPSHVYPFVA